jgi:hypothetical protein
MREFNLNMRWFANGAKDHTGGLQYLLKTSTIRKMAVKPAGSELTI